VDRSRSWFIVCAGLFSLSLFLPCSASSAWPTDPTVNVPLCTAPNIQGFAWRPQRYDAIVSDGADGAIVTWTDMRSGSTTHSDIYAQRISAAGTVQWTTDGVALCTAAGIRFDSVIVPDGAGGAIVAWNDQRNGGDNTDIYAQRISADGTPQWTANGVALCTATGSQEACTMVSDGAGGAIVTWHDNRNGNITDIFAQRVSAGGVPQWTADGVALCTAVGNQDFPQLASDGAGGAIVTWEDFRSGGTDWDIYAQRVSADGTVQWAANGVALCTAARAQQTTTIVSDGAGGAIVAWEDYRSNASHDVYAQRVSAAGLVQWTTDGVALCAATGEQSLPSVLSDGAGGAIVTWNDQRSGNWDIYAQRVSAAGLGQWTTDGVALCTATGDQSNASITPDGAGGAIVTWNDLRSGNWDIYAQRVSLIGAPQWTADGVALSTATGNQVSPMVASDGASGAIVAWQDYRSGNWDIYSQRVGAAGQLVDVPAEAPAAFALDPVRPNPSRGGALTIHFSLPTDAPARLDLLDVAGRCITSQKVGVGQHTLDLGTGQHLPPGLYLVRLTQGANTRTTRVAVLR
jgi:hypothetical protein